MDDVKQFRSLGCENWFIEPLAWLQEMKGDTGGIKCPGANCNQILGVWHWEDFKYART